MRISDWSSDVCSSDLEEHLSPYNATVKAMGQITGAIVGITLVLMAVFVPMAFFPGSTGGIYRQFSVTLIVSIGFSALLALTLTPALCATFLKPHVPEDQRKENRSEEHTSELQSLMRISYAVFCLKKKTLNTNTITICKHKIKATHKKQR